MEGRSDHVADGINVDIWSKIFPAQGRETPLELLLTGGSLSESIILGMLPLLCLNQQGQLRSSFSASMLM